MRKVDNKCIVLLITITTRSGLTEQDAKNVHQFLDCMATYPNSVVKFHASDIILRADTNVSYLTAPEAYSRDAGYFF